LFDADVQGFWDMPACWFEK